MIVYVPARRRRSLSMELARFVAWLGVGVLVVAAAALAVEAIFVIVRLTAL